MPNENHILDFNFILMRLIFAKIRNNDKIDLIYLVNNLSQ